MMKIEQTVNLEEMAETVDEAILECLSGKGNKVTLTILQADKISRVLKAMHEERKCESVANGNEA